MKIKRISEERNKDKRETAGLTGRGVVRGLEWGGGGLNSKHFVYDILPSTTAVFSYAIGSRKLSANEQFFVGAQTEVILL